MSVYKIAELFIKINTQYSKTAEKLSQYLCDSDSFDFEISLTQDEIIARSEREENPCEAYEAEGLLILEQLCYKVLESYNGFFFHSSALMMNGEAYVFTAPSGTGKSTHTALWRKYFGEKVTMINDDKPIIRKIDGKFYICGTPWMGKSNIGNNINAPVKAVYILKRNNCNRATKVSAGKYINKIFEATIIPKDKMHMIELLRLTDEFFEKIPLFLLECSIDKAAVEAAYNAIN